MALIFFIILVYFIIIFYYLFIIIFYFLMSRDPQYCPDKSCMLTYKPPSRFFSGFHSTRYPWLLVSFLLSLSLHSPVKMFHFTAFSSVKWLRTFCPGSLYQMKSANRTGVQGKTLLSNLYFWTLPRFGCTLLKTACPVHTSGVLIRVNLMLFHMSNGTHEYSFRKCF